MSNNIGMTSLNKTRSTEWLLALCAIGWGWTVLQPGQLFEMPMYRLLSAVFRETTWGAIAVLIGMLRCVGLGINGFWRRSPLVRMAGSAASGLFWMVVAFLMFVSVREFNGTLPAGWVYYLIFFAFEGWCVAAAGYDMFKNASLSRRVA